MLTGNHQRQYSRKSLPTGDFPCFAMDDCEIRPRRCDAGGVRRVRHFVNTIQKLNCTTASANAVALRHKDSPTAAADNPDLNDTQDESTVSSIFFPVVFTDDEPCKHRATKSAMKATRRWCESETYPDTTAFRPSSVSSMQSRRGQSFGKVGSYTDWGGSSDDSTISSCSEDSSDESNDDIINHQKHAVVVPFDERCFTYSPSHEFDPPPVPLGFVIEIPSNTEQRSARVARTSMRDNHVPVRRTIDLLNDASRCEGLVYNPGTTEPPTLAEFDAELHLSNGNDQQHLSYSVMDKNGLHDNESTTTPPWIQRPGCDSPDNAPAKLRAIPFPVQPRHQMSPVDQLRNTSFVVPAMVDSSSRKLSNKLYTKLQKPVALRSVSTSTTVSGTTVSQTAMTPSTSGSSKVDRHKHHHQHECGSSDGHVSSTIGALDQQQIQWLVSTIAATLEQPTLLDYSGFTYQDNDGEDESSGPTSADQWLRQIRQVLSATLLQTNME